MTFQSESLKITKYVCEKIDQDQILKNTKKLCENCNILPRKINLNKTFSKTCSVKCRYELRTKNLTKDIECKCCDKIYKKINIKSKFCSILCSKKYRANLKFTGVEGIDFIICPICNIKAREISPRHAHMHGFETIKEMKSILNFDTRCEAKKRFF